MKKKFLTTDEINTFYGIDEATIQALVDSGDLKALADRGTWKYRREDLDVLIETGKLHPTKDLPEMGEDEIDSDPDFPLGSAGNEKVEYMELDESALTPEPPAKATSSSDVVVVLEPKGASGSDSDVHLGRSRPPAPSDEAKIATEPDKGTFSVGSESVLDEDSGITLEAGDSGISLAKEDSGITLAAGDSGISLEKADSGITLKSDDRAASVIHDADTEFMDEIGLTPDQEFKVAEDSGIPQLKFQESASDIPKFVEDKADDGGTTVLSVSDDEEPMSFSGAVEAGESVQDLEVVDELDVDAVDSAAVLDDFEEGEVLEASDEVFSEEFESEAAEGEEVLAAAPSKARAEPSWGMLVNLSVIAASVLIALNAWLALEGMFTMWTGAPTSGVASSLISALAGLM